MGGEKRRVETGLAGGHPEDNMIFNQMMLRFRPIAPRPVTVEGSVGLAPAKENINNKRPKRKYVRVKKKKMMTQECNYKVPALISFDVSGINNSIISKWIPPSVGLHDVGPATAVNRRPSVESWVTVEWVTGTCEDGREVQYYTDLETDSCPGFISNGWDEVRWVNLAYRRMVDPNPDGGVPPAELVVWLTVKAEKSGFQWWPAFSCRVRMVYDMSSPEKKKKQMTVPCDVWKMDSGEYAWRLDVKAALSLGRLN